LEFRRNQVSALLAREVTWPATLRLLARLLKQKQ